MCCFTILLFLFTQPFILMSNDFYVSKAIIKLVMKGAVNPQNVNYSFKPYLACSGIVTKWSIKRGITCLNLSVYIKYFVPDASVKCQITRTFIVYHVVFIKKNYTNNNMICTVE